MTEFPGEDEGRPNPSTDPDAQPDTRSEPEGRPAGQPDYETEPDRSHHPSPEPAGTAPGAGVVSVDAEAAGTAPGAGVASADPEGDGTAPGAGVALGTVVSADAGADGAESGGGEGGHPLVEGAMERLGELRDRPVSEHAEVYADLHERLQEALSDADAPNERVQ